MSRTVIDAATEITVAALNSANIDAKTIGETSGKNVGAFYDALLTAIVKSAKESVIENLTQ